MPPARLAHEVSGRYLSLLEPERIAALRRMGMGVRQMARKSGRNPSTVSRELKRNDRPYDRGLYHALLAHTRAQEKACRVKIPILARDPEFRDLVQEKLQLKWSPEQIAGWLRVTYPERTNWHLCHETIYQALYHAQETGLARELTRRLGTGRPLRKRRRRSDRRQVTLVERRSRFVYLVALPHGHGADALVKALAPVLATIPAACRHTLTWDQGGETANHQQIARYFSEGVFFTEAGSPWQKATVENTNGLTRLCLPKHLSVARHESELQAIAQATKSPAAQDPPMAFSGWRLGYSAPPSDELRCLDHLNSP